MNLLLRTSAAGLLLVGAGPAPALDAKLAPIQSGLDYHSFANVEQFRVTHVELNLRVDFTNKVLFGGVALEIKRLDPRATELVLDTRDLDIRDVSEKASNVLGATSKSETTWVSRPFHFDKADPVLGSPLVIELPPSKKTTELIKIEYVTSPTSPALQWFTAKQTAGHHQPLMYTLSEPLGARSWIPLQDTPQVRATYTALIHTSKDVLAVMSARNDPNVKHNGEYSFAMVDAIPSYLIALAIGDLRFRETGPRSGVYAEKPLAAPAAKEFADTETMIRAAEKLIGPYRWDRYDILVLPASFPVAGVGTPRLAFISPTVITGDKSEVSVSARALAQSWSGDLVSGATWRDSWITEGLADYLKSRIMTDVYGERRDSMERAHALRSFHDDLAALKPEDQALAVDLRERDPGLIFSDAPSRKSGLLFAFLGGKFGRERFDPFLRGFFDHFALKSVSTEQFLAYLKENLLDRFPGVVTRDQVRQWVMDPGIPADALLPASGDFQAVDAARSAWLDGKLAAKKIDTREWLTQQWQYFLEKMPATLRKEQLAELDRAFDFSRSGNAEVAGSWLMLVIRTGYQPGYPRLEQYLVSIGRRTLIEPLYAQLMKTPAGATLAKRVYAAAKAGYHSRTVAAIDPIVNPASEASDDE